MNLKIPSFCAIDFRAFKQALWLAKFTAGLVVVSVSLGLAVTARAQASASVPFAPVTPIDQERDRQSKVLLQQKIDREIKENERRVTRQRQLRERFQESGSEDKGEVKDHRENASDM